MFVPYNFVNHWTDWVIHIEIVLGYFIFNFKSAKIVKNHFIVNGNQIGSAIIEIRRYSQTDRHTQLLLLLSNFLLKNKISFF